jgi:hypothetical protein
MLAILKWIFIGHVHKWSIHNERMLTDDTGARGTRYILKCDHCGRMKKFDAI